MALTIWKPRTYLSPWNRLGVLEDDLNRIWDITIGRTPEDRVENWLPAIDVKENEKEITVVADVPGLEKENLTITVHEGVLTVRGERKQEEEVREENYHRVERTYGTFERRIGLPAEVDGETVKATFRNGVLKIVLPKTERAQPRQIEVKTE